MSRKPTSRKLVRKIKRSVKKSMKKSMKNHKSSRRHTKKHMLRKKGGDEIDDEIVQSEDDIKALKAEIAGYETIINSTTKTEEEKAEVVRQKTEAESNLEFKKEGLELLKVSKAERTEAKKASIEQRQEEAKKQAKINNKELAEREKNGNTLTTNAANTMKNFGNRLSSLFNKRPSTS